MNSLQDIMGTIETEAVEAYDDATTEESSEVRGRRFRCSDGMCGADDCSRCGDGGGD